jgi:hypothetical protein
MEATLATRFNDRRTAATAETNADYPVSVGTGSEALSRPASLNSAEQNTPVNNRPTLTGWGPSVTFAENLVNATPQLLDADVVFNDIEGNFSGGRLTLSGLLAEDRASVRNEGTGAGQIGLSGVAVTFGGVIIGALSGGSGATLTITFNAAATSVSIDALIQNLTYANVSNTPTATRNLVLNVIDAAGDSLAGAGGSAPTFAERTGAASPFNSFGLNSNASAPAFADLDGDGDLDLVLGWYLGTLFYFENTGTASAPIFTQRSNAANPFSGVHVGTISAPTFADLDGDGDLDALIGAHDGTLRYFQNTNTATAPVFVQQTGATNPFNGVDVGAGSAPTFADLDGDGDLDALFGATEGTLSYFQNTGTATAPIFTERTGAANPFNGVDVGIRSTPTFADLDGDGDLDAVVGEEDGILNYFENTGTATAPIFTERTGAANPFNGVDVGDVSAPAFADLDGDGDLDLAVGNPNGVRNYFENGGAPIAVNVTPQNDVPTITGLPSDVTVVEDVTSNLNLSAVTLTYVDTTGSITVVLTASAGTMIASSGGGVTVTNSGTGAITLTGTAAAIDAYLNTASAVRYTGALNASGDNAATLTITVNDGSGSVTLGVVNIDITPVNDVPTITGLPTDLTVVEP